MFQFSTDNVNVTTVDDDYHAVGQRLSRGWTTTITWLDNDYHAVGQLGLKLSRTLARLVSAWVVCWSNLVTGRVFTPIPQATSVVCHKPLTTCNDSITDCALLMLVNGSVAAIRVE